MTTLPPEIAEALGADAERALHLRLRSGLDTPTGESHLVVANGKLRVYARDSLLDPLTELRGPSGARLTVTSLRTELHVDHPHGVAKVSLGYGEQELVEALLNAIRPQTAVEQTTGSTAQPASAPAEVTSASPASAAPLFPLPATAASRSRLLDLLESRRAAMAHAETTGPFASLLSQTHDRKARRALFDARAALGRGNRDEAILILAQASKRPPWSPKVALGELLFDVGRYEEAIGAARQASDAGAPSEWTTPLLERASRAAEDDPALVRALEAKRKLARDRAERREIEDELREVRQRRDAAKQARARKAHTPAPAGDRDTNQRKHTTGNEERSRMGKRRPPGAPQGPPRDDETRDDGRPRPASAEPAQPTRPSMLPWLVLAVLLLVGIGAALRRVLGAP